MEISHEHANVLSESDIRIIKEMFVYVFPDFKDMKDSELWGFRKPSAIFDEKKKTFNILGIDRLWFFYFGLFFNVTDSGEYIAFFPGSDEDKPYGRKQTLFYDDELFELMVQVLKHRIESICFTFKENNYDFEKEQEIPYSSPFVCAKRGVPFVDNIDD